MQRLILAILFYVFEALFFCGFFVLTFDHEWCVGMGIYDAMKLVKADVSTVCLGLAASMGAFLLATGTKGKRFCMPNSRVMIHQPLGTAGGKVSFDILCIYFPFSFMAKVENRELLGKY